MTTMERLTNPKPKANLSPDTMFKLSRLISLALLIALLLSCDKTPGGVMSVNEMADLIVDLQLAEAYIDTHNADFESDSSRQVIKQSIFKKHGITQQEYDSSLVWYAHNMEDYTKAYDKAIGKLQSRYDKLEKKGGNGQEEEIIDPGMPTHDATPRNAGPKLTNLSRDAHGDTIDMWQDQRSFMLTQGYGRGFITFDLPPDAEKQRGDRYQLAYKLTRGGNEFKVSLNVDYTDGSTHQISRGTNNDGWVMIDIQSDTARQVRRVYGYVSYDMKRAHTAYVDSLMLMRTHLSLSNYGLIHAQRELDRNKK